ncbi:hypothetical protein QUB60_14795 [Microcoleus sp. A2-C5]|uniref:hypothetical protein n=1 Tax=unclassified Microcoleus TaxID=2642155 RepID=UPI002FCEF6B3
MIKPVSDGSEYTRGYQQALDDFGVTQLLSRIRCYSDDDFDADRTQLTQQELESLVAIVIERVAVNIKGSAIARYLNSLRNANSPIAGGDRNSWAIVRILPNAQHYTIARFFNRQDADDRLRALCRFVPDGVFEVVWVRSGLINKYN